MPKSLAGIKNKQIKEKRTEKEKRQNRFTCEKGNILKKKKGKE